VKNQLSNFLTDETHPAIAAFAAAILAYANGELSEIALDNVVRKLEGKPEWKPKIN